MTAVKKLNSLSLEATRATSLEVFKNKTAQTFVQDGVRKPEPGRRLD